MKRRRRIHLLRKLKTATLLQPLDLTHTVVVVAKVVANMNSRDTVHGTMDFLLNYCAANLVNNYVEFKFFT